MPKTQLGRIYVAAAIIVHRLDRVRNSYASCGAVQQAAQMKNDCASSCVVRNYAQMFKPDNCLSAFWPGLYYGFDMVAPIATTKKLYRESHQHRLTMLCMAAPMADTGDL